jgi:hypothetical protein
MALTCRTSHAPRAPPPSMRATASRRRARVTWPRCPDRGSAPIPVSVMVSTVVVRSGTASVRAAEFCTPIATASSSASASMTTAVPPRAEPPAGSPPVAAAITSAATTRAASAAVAARTWAARSPPSRVVSTPPSAAPIRKPASAKTDALSEKPGAPTSANPAKTTLPVMLATNTRPSARIDTASTRPVTSVSASSSSGRGPQPGPDTGRQSRAGRHRGSGAAGSAGAVPAGVPVPPGERASAALASAALSSGTLSSITFSRVCRPVPCGYAPCGVPLRSCPPRARPYPAGMPVAGNNARGCGVPVRLWASVLTVISAPAQPAVDRRPGLVGMASAWSPRFVAWHKGCLGPGVRGYKEISAVTVHR